MPAVRPAAVAGTFFPADVQALREALAAHLAGVPIVEGSGQPPKLLVVPHAGYVYSGAVAALAYAPLARWRGVITRVVLLGPTHRVAVQGLAAPTVGAFETPLGRVAVDEASLAALADLPQVVRADRPHAQEHSLEVQLPFLQTVLGPDFQLVPLAVGRASPGEVAEVLERLWGGEETLIVISSDLSHFLPYEQAQLSDRETVRRIMQFATDLRGDEACGAAPLNGALQAARRHGLTPRLLGLRNSGDTERGDRQRVVGYGAIAFDTAPLSAPSDDDALGRELVAQARQAIANALAGQADAAPTAARHPALLRPGATFVTLHDAQGRLRGCVGRLEATRLLGVDVRANARAAAFEDSRFEPLRASEWPGLRVEVSLLDTPEPMAVADEAAALAALRPGVDGLILQWRGTRATLLPQVWEQCPQPSQFMAALKRKAGLPADLWPSDVRLSRYRVRSFTDTGAQPVAAGSTA